MSAKLCAMLYCVYKGREIVFAGRMAFGTVAREALDSIRIGINLTIANIAGNLILGGGRFIIDRYWGIEDFGEVSFSLTLTNFSFTVRISDFDGTVSSALRQIDEKRQKRLFEMSKHVLNVILPTVFLVYIPAKETLKLWLPQYEASLAYMAILLPMCIFDGKMNLVCATYFKVLRKERFLLYVNIFSMALSIVLSIVGAYWPAPDSRSDYSVYGMFDRCEIFYFTKLYLERLLGQTSGQAGARVGMAEELVLVADLRLCVLERPHFSGSAFAITAIAYLIYLVLNRRSVGYLWGMVKAKITK